jgi:hypothetical protein
MITRCSPSQREVRLSVWSRASKASAAERSAAALILIHNHRPKDCTMTLPTPKAAYQASTTGERPLGYSSSGRYPDHLTDYEDDLSSLLTRDEIIEMLPTLLRSPDIGDRVRARAVLTDLRATVPAGTWLVVEMLDSPNLKRSATPPHEKHVEQRTWSAHIDRADAEAWSESTQANCDKQHRPHWGDESRRHFGVVQAEEKDFVSVGYLRQPGASTVYNQAFKH